MWHAVVCCADLKNSTIALNAKFWGWRQESDCASQMWKPSWRFQFKQIPINLGPVRTSLPPSQVLVREPMLETMVWTYTTSVSEMRESGVEVCSGCSPNVFVCAVPTWGPGKVVRFRSVRMRFLLAWKLLEISDQENIGARVWRWCDATRTRVVLLIPITSWQLRTKLQT